MAAWSAYSSASPPAPSTFATTRNGSHDSRPSRSRCPSPLREDRYIGGPVINVFDNLLPDSEPIRRRVAERVGATGMDAYSMLSALGHDCVEALQFLPEGIDPGPAGKLEDKLISDDEVAHIIQNLAAARRHLVFRDKDVIAL